MTKMMLLPMMRKENYSIVKLNTTELNNMAGANTGENADEHFNNETLQSEFHLGLFIILIFLTLPPSLTVILHILM